MYSQWGITLISAKQSLSVSLPIAFEYVFQAVTSWDNPDQGAINTNAFNLAIRPELSRITISNTSTQVISGRWVVCGKTAS